MRRRFRTAAVVVSIWLAVCGAWVPGGAPHGDLGQVAAQQLSGRVLAVIGRQVGFLNFDAPRPRVLTTLSAPSFAMDVSAVASTTIAVISVAEPLQAHGQGDLGGDLFSLDLASPDEPLMPLVMRSDAGEWLGAPVWLPDGSAILFQREDVQAGSDLYAGQAGVRYPSRIEMVSPNGSGRSVVIAYGHHPSPSPDGSEIAFVRLSARGSMLIAQQFASGEERTLVSAGALPDLAYPRYSPAGDRVAFVATTASAKDTTQPQWFAPHIALAHGAPWNLWIVNRDGSGLRQLAAVGADDASLAWSPDGSAIFVYGSTGARVVDANTGETDLLPYLAGFGAISWLP